MSLLVTFYWQELVRWPCNFMGVRKCRRESIIFGENSVSTTRSMGKNPIRRSGAGVLRLKSGEENAREHIHKRGGGKQQESLVC